MKSETFGYSGTFKDCLTTYNGSAIMSDTTGNPLLYNNGTQYSMTWTRGNKLASVKPSGYNNYQSYTYDSDGLRTGKTLVANNLSTKKIKYFWVGNTLKSEWAESGVQHFP